MAPDTRTIQCLVAKFWETGSVGDIQKCHSGQHRSAVIPENIQNLEERLEESPRKSTCCLSQETRILRISVLRILHDELKLFSYKIQILQKQTDHNKGEQKKFCEDIDQKIKNNPGL